jgi:hypothetical protein
MYVQYHGINNLCLFFPPTLISDEEKVTRDGNDRPILKKEEIEVVCLYLRTWPER